MVLMKQQSHRKKYRRGIFCFFLGLLNVNPALPYTGMIHPFDKNRFVRL
jgi:hypothetical protein